MTMREKLFLARRYWNPKRKLGVTTHFLEIIKQHLFKKAVKYKEINGFFFSLFQSEVLLYLKNAWFPPIFEHLLSSAFSP